MAESVRILSDVHFGDRASSVGRLAQLHPLLDADAVVFNGDTLDTRPSRALEHTQSLRAQVNDFARGLGTKVTFLTGNHDPDFSPQHLIDLADGQVCVTHGDILFDTIVPWSRDVPLIESLLAAEFAALSADHHDKLDQRFAIWRRVAGRVPQRHQSEPNPMKHLLQLASDTVWPPHRLLRIVRAWWQAPGLAAEFLRRHRPDAKFIVTGHTHRPGIWRRPNGRVVINTGSFCPPLGGCVVDITPSQVAVRRVVNRAGEFRLGRTIVEFPL